MVNIKVYPYNNPYISQEDLGDLAEVEFRLWFVVAAVVAAQVVVLGAAALEVPHVARHEVLKQPLLTKMLSTTIWTSTCRKRNHTWTRS